LSIIDHRLARVEMSPSPNRFWSAVTNVRCKVWAVAARKRSAGSLWGKGNCLAASAISCVNGASRRGAVACATHCDRSAGRRIFPFVFNVSASQVLMGESQSSFSGLLSSSRTLSLNATDRAGSTTRCEYPEGTSIPQRLPITFVAGRGDDITNDLYRILHGAHPVGRGRGARKEQLPRLASRSGLCESVVSSSEPRPAEPGISP